MYLCTTCLPLEKEISGYLSEYIHGVARNSGLFIEHIKLVIALKCSINAGRR